MRAVSIRGWAFAAIVCVSLVAAAGAARGAEPVVGWGEGGSQGSLGITASAIAAGRAHDCAIQASSGAVVCWGADDWGKATRSALEAPDPIRAGRAAARGAR
jgi:hypothetical protein